MDTNKTARIIKALSDPEYTRPWLRGYYKPKGDFLKDGFTPQGVDLRDFSIIKHQDQYHLFYIDHRPNQSSRTPGQGIFIGHSSTPNFVNWIVHEPVLYLVPGTWEGGHVTASYVLKHKNLFYMFYTGLSSTLSQSIGLAYSSDLFQWTRYEGNPILHPGFFKWACWSRTNLSSCRDPHVLVHNHEFILYYTVLCKTGNVAIAAVKSDNLLNWTDSGMVYEKEPEEEMVPMMLESPCVHRLEEGQYGLFFSWDFATHLVISDNPFSWQGKAHSTILKNHLGLEVVEKRGKKWLAAFFSQATQDRGGRFFLGTLDWSKKPWRVQIVTRKEELKPFLK